MRFALIALLLPGCAFAPSHKGDPQTCRERVAFRLAAAYPDPNNLKIAIDTVCSGIPFIGPTTTREP